MKIVVLVKQVPATDKVKMDEETGTISRNEAEGELNPLDLYSIEEAIRVKERLGEDTKITVLSMGTQVAIKTVRDAIAMGCDEGYLLSDIGLAGSDTYATSYALSLGIKRIQNDFDIIFCGEKSTDGETGVLAPCIAAQLDIPIVNFVTKIDEIKTGKIIVHRAIEGGHEVLEATTPLLVSVIKEINEPRYITLKGKLRAKKMEIPILNATDIGADEDRIGSNGSLTKVIDIFHSQRTRKGHFVFAEKDLNGAVNILTNFLEKHL